MRLGVIGRGYWGNTYARTLEKLGIEFWQAGRSWGGFADGIIVASSSESHFWVAREVLSRGIPLLLEKPVALRSEDAKALVKLGGIAFAGHTRLYDPGWEKFKASLPKIESVEAFAGGVTESNPDPLWNWGAHLAAMCLDLGFDPMQMQLRVTAERQPLRFIVNNEFEFRDGGAALDCLILEFCAAIEKRVPNNEGLKLGLQTVEYVERVKNELRRLHVA